MSNKGSIDKRIELALKRKLKNYVSLNLNPVAISKPDDLFHLPDKCKILLLRQDRIGDVLISVPTVRALRKRFPDAVIDIVLSRKNNGVANAISKFVDKIWIYDKEIISIFRLIRNLREEKYDIVIDMLTSTSTTSSFLIKKIYCKNILGFDKENRKSYSHIIDISNESNVHIVKITAKLLMAFGIDLSSIDYTLDYQISEEDKKKADKYLGAKTKTRIGINLSGSSKAKFWGLNNYIDFIKVINKKYEKIEIFIFTTYIHKSTAIKIIKETVAKLANITNSINEYACQLSTCDVILTPDTSAVHFAASFKIPCIALYNKRQNDNIENIWTSFGSPCIALTTKSGNLSDISVDEVSQAFEKLIEK